MAEEPIELQCRSSLKMGAGGGIDKLIAQYERLQDFHSKLNTLTIKVSATGLTELNRELREAQITMGRIAAVKVFDRQNKEMMQSGRQMREMRKELDEYWRAFHAGEHTKGRPTWTAEDVSKADRVMRARGDAREAEFKAVKEHHERIQSQQAAFVKAAGLKALPKVEGPDPLEQMRAQWKAKADMSAQAQKLAEAEGKLKSPVEATTASLDKQTAITKKKAATTKQATEDIGKLATQEKGLGGASGKAIAKTAPTPEEYKAANPMMQGGKRVPQWSENKDQFLKQAIGNNENIPSKWFVGNEQLKEHALKSGYVAQGDQWVKLAAPPPAAPPHKPEPPIGGGGGGGGRLYVQTDAEGAEVASKYQLSRSETLLKTGEKEITTRNDLAGATERAAAAENKYRVASKQAGDDLRRKLTVTEDYVRSLRAQRDALKDYRGTPLYARVEGKVAGGEAAQADIANKIRSQERAAQDSIQKQRSAALIRQQTDEEKATARRIAAEQTSVESLQKQRSAALIRQQTAEERATEKRKADEAAAVDALQKQRSAALVQAEKDRQRSIEQQAKGEKQSVASLQQQRSAALVAQGREAEKIAAKQAAELQRQREAAALKAGVQFGPDFKKVSSSTGSISSKGRTETTTFERTAGGLRERVTLTEKYNASNRLMEVQATHAEKAVKDLGRTGDWTARSFLHNTFVVAAWAASVGTLYKALGMIEHGAAAAIKLERNYALLKTVFHGTDEEALKLRDSTTELAVAQGIDANQALDAAVRFSRLGLTRIQVQEAVTVSLKAANSAQITVAESAENLSSIMASYNLQVRDLRGTLAGVVAISNNYNVTTKDIFNGIARVGNIARMAGLPLRELMGIIGAGVGRTGRPGAEFGNAIKAMIVSLSTPAIQTKLENRFAFSVKDQSGEMKDMSALLAELYIKYQELTSAERGELLQKVGQKQQAARLAAILDGYVQSQALSIRAYTQMNAAERENMNIRASMVSQLQSLSSEFERLSVNMLASNESFAATQVLQNTIKGITNAIKVLSDHPQAFALMVGLAAMMSARMAVLAFRYGEAGTKANFFTNTLKQVAMAQVAMAEAVTRGNAALAAQGGLFVVAGKSIGGLARLFSFKAIGSALASLFAVLRFGLGTVARFAGGIAGIALFEAGLWGVNKAFDYFRKTSEDANAALIGFDDEIEKHNNLGQAAAQSARLFQTVSKAAPKLDERSFGLAASGIAQVMEPVDERKRRDVEKDLLDTFKQQNGVQEIQQRLGALQQVQLEKARVERQETISLSERQLNLQNKLLASVQAEIAAKDAKGKPADREREKEKSLLDRIKSLSEKRSQDYSELVDELGEQENSMEKIAKARFEGQNRGLEAVSGKTPTFGPTQKLDEEIGLLRTKLRLLDDNRAAAKGAYDEAVAQSDTKIQKAKDELEAWRAAHPKKEQAFDAAAFDAQAASLGNSGLGSAASASGAWLKRQLKGEGWTPFGNRPLIERGTRNERFSPSTINPQPSTRLPSGGTDERTREAQLQDAVAGTTQAEKDKTAALEAQTTALEKLNEKEREAIELGIEKAQTERDRLAAAMEAQDLGSRQAKETGARNRWGVTETDKLFNESAGLMRDIQGVTTTKRTPIIERGISTPIDDYGGRKVRWEHDKPEGNMFSQALFARGSSDYQYTEDLAKKDEANGTEPGYFQRRQRVTGYKTETKTSGGLAEQLKEARIEERMASPGGPGDEGGDKAAAQAAVLKQLTLEQRIREELNQLQQNEVAASMRKATIEAEIKTTKQQQNIEASKALLMGSREEQMQAAMLARFQQKRGGKQFTVNDFQFLSQGTRQNIEKFAPDAAPKELNTTMRQLTNELAKLNKGIDKMVADRKALEKELPKDINPTATAARAGAQEGKTNPDVPAISVNVGSVVVDVGDQFAKITTQFQQVVLAQVQPQLDAMNQRITTGLAGVSNAGGRS